MTTSINHTSVPICRGRVTAAHQIVIDADLPGAKVGMRVLINPEDPVVAEVVAFNGTSVRLLPLSHCSNVGIGVSVTTFEESPHIPVSDYLLGRIIDPLGRPLDDGPVIRDTCPWPLMRNAPSPLSRRPIRDQLITGIRAIDGCFGLGYGQRIGLFAGPGLGKTTLLGTLAKRAKTDINIICLVGERGIEVKTFLNRFCSSSRLSQSVIVLSSADDPPMCRICALDTATAIAEWYSLKGKNVLLVVDSLTRVVRARRDMAFALGETPTRGGYPTSAFTTLPTLIERTGCDENGTITSVYAVLTESNKHDPVAEEAISLLDGHIVLSQKLADRGHWPAVDVLKSISRVQEAIIPPDYAQAAQRLKTLISAYDEHEDLILMGAYRPGTSPDTDIAVEKREEISAFLAQPQQEQSSLEETRESLLRLAGPT